METSKSFIKTKINCNSNFIRDLCENSPSAIINVLPDHNIVVISQGLKGLTALSFNRSEFKKAKLFIVKEIKSRTDPDERVEPWECKNLHGVYSYRKELLILSKRKHQGSAIKSQIDHRALKELCNANNVKEYMGKLYLSELKLNHSNVNAPARYQAKLLGLIK